MTSTEFLAERDSIGASWDAIPQSQIDDGNMQAHAPFSEWDQGTGQPQTELQILEAQMKELTISAQKAQEMAETANKRISLLQNIMDKREAAIRDDLRSEVDHKIDQAKMEVRSEAQEWMDQQSVRLMATEERLKNQVIASINANKDSHSRPSSFNSSPNSDDVRNQEQRPEDMRERGRPTPPFSGIGIDGRPDRRTRFNADNNNAENRRTSSMNQRTPSSVHMPPRPFTPARTSVEEASESFWITPKDNTKLFGGKWTDPPMLEPNKQKQWIVDIEGFMRMVTDDGAMVNIMCGVQKYDNINVQRDANTRIYDILIFAIKKSDIDFHSIEPAIRK